MRPSWRDDEESARGPLHQSRGTRPDTHPARQATTPRLLPSPSPHCPPPPRRGAFLWSVGPGRPHSPPLPPRLALQAPALMTACPPLRRLSLRRLPPRCLRSPC